MERQITDEEWSEFINLVVKVLEGHQDPTFIETVALRLSEDVHNQLREWKTRLEGSNANCAKQTRYVLKTWKSLQTQLDLDFLVHEFDQRLSTEKLANELRTKVVTRFNNRKNGNGKLCHDNF